MRRATSFEQMKDQHPHVCEDGKKVAGEYEDPFCDRGYGRGDQVTADGIRPFGLVSRVWQRPSTL